ncbi:LysR substrate-binding domain-containing protein [Pseudoxanthomonas putridarboris]|uniref:LysR substrate-binding domain-containing protein n=1 Tax=Pseudoxanthomonas putridarboris TaxID=752605 RepID=A0ABU9IZX7_9GAMM
MSALRAFEAVARRSSFKAAAEELFVTPTAISHQIKQLESHLGLRVLDRTPRAVKLTAAGTALYQATAAGFAEIERAVALLRIDAGPTTITLSSFTAFLGHWLVPRLDALHRAMPMSNLRLHASDIPEDLRAGGIEVAIRYGRGPYPGTASARLCDDVLVPVCSPKLGLSRPEDLSGATLIHIDGRNRPAPAPDWFHWCAKAGIAGLDANAGPRFPDSMLAVQAAIAAQGVVIVSRVLVADAMAAGLLEAPFAQTLAGDAYFFCCAEELEMRADIVALRKWFQDAFSRERPEIPDAGAGT